jgi:SAM-dependent methyltransferase
VISDYVKLHIQDKISGYNKSTPLIDELLPFVEDKKEVKIADIGSGPFSFIGSTLPGVKIEVYPSDKQDFYRFWEVRGQKPYIPVEYQDMEKLTYPDEFFDIVFCHNALDHTKNAKVAVQEMVRVCKTGGWVVIICSLNQLDTGYLHFWNAKEDGTFTNKVDTFDLKDLGFKIKFTDNGGESRYNLITATLKK